MAALSGIMNSLRPLLILNNPIVLKYLPLFFIGASFGGSVLKELDVVPDTYFSNRRNVLNLYFVKLSWGWTLGLLLPFIYLSNSNRKRLMCLITGTAIWYFCTKMFFYIEDYTGTCYESNSLQTIREGFSTKAECTNAGLFWDGFDISGHSFILSYSSLLIVEEMAALHHPIQLSHKKNTILNILYIALNIIVYIWVLMFICTSVYFHNMIQKILGTLFGLLGWFMTYKVWYLNPQSSGLPSRQNEHKQHN